MRRAERHSEMTPERPKEGLLLPPYRVLDLAGTAGVLCGKLLADHGADVILVEPPSGHSGRARAPFAGDDPHPEKSLYFLYYNTNKRSVTLNLETEAGRSLFRRLATKADVVVESFPVGYLGSLGLDYESLKETNPGLVMASITPFGQSGPWREFKSSDLIAMASSGFMQITGDPDGPPVRQGNEQSHFAGAQYGAVAILAALYYRDMLSGTGQYIDVSQQEALITYYTDAHPALAWQQLGENVTRVGTSSTLAVPLGAYPCRDGWISAGVVTPREWDGLAQWMHEVTGNEEILREEFRGGNQERALFVEELTALFIDFTTRFTAEELFHEGQRRNLVFVPVNDVTNLIGTLSWRPATSGPSWTIQRPVRSSIPWAYSTVKKLAQQGKPLLNWATTTSPSTAKRWGSRSRSSLSCEPTAWSSAVQRQTQRVADGQ